MGKCFVEIEPWSRKRADKTFVYLTVSSIWSRVSVSVAWHFSLPVSFLAVGCCVGGET